MPLARVLPAAILACVSACLAAQEPAPKPEAKSTETKTAEPQPSRHDGECRERHWHYRYRREFGAYAQAVMPLRDLRDSLDHHTGFGLGLQWIHDHGDWNASRTRLEWNTFPEGGPVGPAGTTTYAKNYVLSFDHLFRLNQGPVRTYLVAGLGGARWDLEQTTAGVRSTLWTNKLAVTGGFGVQLGPRVDLEARYVVGSLNRTFDANTLQASLGWHF